MAIVDRAEQEESVMERLKDVEAGEETEDAEFVRLHKLLPFLTSSHVSQLDIVLEAITYIHLLQARLQGQEKEPRGQ